MNKIQLGVDAIQTTPLILGFEGEQNHTEITFYWTVLYGQYPDAVATMVIKPPVGDPYPKTVTQEDNKVVWTVTAADMANDGSGEYQLTFTNGDEIIKTYIGSFNVMSSIVGNGEAPDPVSDWVTDANGKLAEVEQTIAEVPEMVEEDVSEAVTDWLEENIDPSTGYVIDKSLTVEDAAADAKAVGDILFNKADCDEELGETIAHVSRMVLSDQSTPDTTPYLFRKSFDADFLEDALVGGSVAWNQLINKNPVNIARQNNVSATYDSTNDAIKVVSTKDANDIKRVRLYKEVLLYNHVYFASGTIVSSVPSTYTAKSMFGFFNNSEGANTVTEVGGGETKSGSLIIKTGDGSSSSTMQFVGIRVSSEALSGEYVEVKNMICIDLTQMFGSTIADYIYTLEQATAGSGIAWLKQYGFFSKPYYAYDAGSIQSVKAKEKRCVGFNAWDEEWEEGYIDNTGTPSPSSDRIRSKNFTRIIPGETYYVHCGANEESYFCFYDENRNYIGRNLIRNTTFVKSDAYYFKLWCAGVSTYANDICINISKTTGTPKNGDYLPYSSTTYPLGSDELRGIPKLDNSNNLYYDGDVKTADGKIARKYGIVDLGTLSWTYDSNYHLFYTTIPALATKNVSSYMPIMVCSKYLSGAIDSTADKSIRPRYAGSVTTNSVVVFDSSYTDAATFTTAMSGVYLVYELATPTTETADPFVKLQYLNPNGTEEYVDAGTTASTPTRDVDIPVGGDRKYYKDFRREIRELIAGLS